MVNWIHPVLMRGSLALDTAVLMTPPMRSWACAMSCSDRCAKVRRFLEQLQWWYGWENKRYLYLYLDIQPSVICSFIQMVRSWRTNTHKTVPCSSLICGWVSWSSWDPHPWIGTRGFSLGFLIPTFQVFIVCNGWISSICFWETPVKHHGNHKDLRLKISEIAAEWSSASCGGHHNQE